MRNIVPRPLRVTAMVLLLLFVTSSDEVCAQSNSVAALVQGDVDREVVDLHTNEVWLKPMPHGCSIDSEAFPAPPFRIGCGTDHAENNPCTIYDCPNCYNFALQLNCYSCWVENITFSFSPSDECFVMCSKPDAPNTPDLGIRPDRSKTCSKLDVQFV